MAPPRGLTPATLEAAAKRLSSNKTWQREFKKGYRRVGNMASRHGRAGMRSAGDRRLAKAARALRSDPYPDAASIVLRGTTAVPGALAASMGMRRRTGFYAAPQFAASTGKQHPDWVGPDWLPFTPGQGPRGLDTLGDHEGEYLDAFAQETLDVIVRAFPPGSVT